MITSKLKTAGCLTSFVFLLAQPLQAQAEAIKLADSLPAIKLLTQFGETHTIEPETRTLLFAADKTASDLLNKVLEPVKQPFLDERHIAVVADISGMPGLISTLIAIPRLRTRPYSILLGDKAEQTDFIPRYPKAVTVISLDQNTVTEIRSSASAEELTGWLDIPSQSDDSESANPARNEQAPSD